MGERPRRRERLRRDALNRQRARLLELVERKLDPPMAVLGFVWLGLVVLDLTRGLSPLLVRLADLIWILFVLNFALEFALAPTKTAYLRRNWLTALSLLAPALRFLRIMRIARLARAARVTRGMRLLRVVSSVNRGLAALGAHMSRRGFGYVVLLTLIVTVGGSAGIFAFERDASGGGLPDFGAALWWTAMIMTTMGSDYWPRTPEGRLLCLLLALYAFAVFGYVTATLASFFVGRDSELDRAAGGEELARLRHEVAALRARLERADASPAAADNAGPAASR